MKVSVAAALTLLLAGAQAAPAADTCTEEPPTKTTTEVCVSKHPETDQKCGLPASLVYGSKYPSLIYNGSAATEFECAERCARNAATTHCQSLGFGGKTHEHRCLLFNKNVTYLQSHHEIIYTRDPRYRTFHDLECYVCHKKT